MIFESSKDNAASWNDLMEARFDIALEKFLACHPYALTPDPDIVKAWLDANGISGRITASDDGEGNVDIYATGMIVADDGEGNVTIGG